MSKHVTISDTDPITTMVQQVAYSGERLIVQHQGKDLVAIIPVEDLELLEEMEDREDLAYIERHQGEPTYPLEQVVQEMGWTKE